MKLPYFLAVFGLFLLGSLTPLGLAAEPAQSPDYAAAKASFTILEATWGSKYKGSKIDHCADVADRVTDLLTHRGWLNVKPGQLHSDPWPNHFKFLYLRYEVLGVTATVIIHEDRRLTLRQLIKHTQIRPPHSDEAPAELEDTVSLDPAPTVILNTTSTRRTILHSSLVLSGSYALTEREI